MRPAGEVRQALLNAALALATPERAPTLRELAIHSQVGFDAARDTLKNMCRANVLRVVRTRRVPYRNKPVAEYAPPEPVVAQDPCRALSDVLGRWAEATA